MQRKSRIRGRKTNLSYQQFEPRQLLAANLVTLDSPIASEFNLVTNGDFETATGGNNGVYSDSNVAGWRALFSTTPPTAGRNELKILTVVEGGRGNVLNLDYLPSQLDGIYQDIETTTGHEYLLTFEMRNRPSSSILDSISNDLEAFWNGTSVGVFSATTAWQKHKINVTGGSGTNDRLEFREVAGASHPGNDGVGPLLDNVTLVRLAGTLLENGSFETTTGEGTGTEFTDQQVPGWSAMGERQLNLLSQNAAHGNRFLNLSSSTTAVNRVYQDVETLAGATYAITFAARTDTDSLTPANDLRVRFQNNWAATVLATDKWEEYTIVVTANSTTSRLVIREPGEIAGDGKGPWIDNVRFTRLVRPGELTLDLNGPGAGVDATASYTEDTGNSPILSDAVEIVGQQGNTVDSAKIVLNAAPNGNSELLSVDVSGTSIVPSYNATTRTLTLSNADTTENYLKVLRTLSYSNPSQNPNTANRLIDITVSSEGITSNSARVSVSIVSVNDAPAIEPVPNLTASAGTSFQRQVNVSDIDSSQLTYQLTVGSRVGSANLETPTVSDTGLIAWSPTESGSFEVTVRVNDGDGGISDETFTMTSVLDGVVPADFVPFSGNRQLSFVQPSLRNQIYQSAPSMNLDLTKNYQAVISTDEGDIVLDLFPDKAPLAVNNFVRLAQDGFYDGLTFHRVIDNFVAQGGDPRGVGNGGPGYNFTDEFDASLNFSGSGVLAMANSGPNSNGSQFFITYSPQNHLTNVHTIFGQLVSGQTALNNLARSEPLDVMRKVTILIT